MERSDVVDYRFLASIWAINNLVGIVISVKILGLKFRPYIAADSIRFGYRVIGFRCNFYCLALLQIH